MKIKMYFLALVVQFASFSYSFSQYSFQHLLGGSDHDRAQTVFSTFDNGYIVNGASFSFGIGDVDAMLIKLDSLGQTIWSKTYGTTEYDNSEYAIETFDHKIVCTGRSNIQPGNPTSAIIYKTDSAGTLLWSKSFGGVNDDGLVHIIETNDGGYAAVGNSSSLTTGSIDVLLIRTDINGDTIFTRSFGSVETEGGSEILQLPDNGFMIAGRQITFPGGTATADALLIRTDSSGNLLWSKSYGDSLWEEFTSVKQTADGGFIICGSTVTFGAGSYDILLLKTDSGGVVQWSKTFGGQETDAAYDLHINSDSSIILFGYTESLGYGHSRGMDSANIFIMKTDLSGNLLWMQVYGDGLQDEAFRGNLAADGGFLVSGFTKNYLFNDSTQMLVIKTDSLGISGCHEQSSQPLDSNIILPEQSISLSVLSGLTFNTIVLTLSSVTVAEDNACLFSGVNSGMKKLNQPIVFPNPFNDHLTIEIDGNIPGENEITINDVYGKLIRTFKTNNSTVKMNTGNMDAGIYILSVKSGGIIGKNRILIKL